MQDYKKKAAALSAQQNTAAPVQAKTNGIPNSAFADVFAGRRRADSSMMGHSQNLAPSIAVKMSQAFGMDLSGMQVYRSDAMVGSGMRGMAQGNKVVLSSDIDLNTMAGQQVLGHEISHIRAQSQGVGTGHSGLYENAALEHQADAEGLMAAQGRSIYSTGAMDMGLGMSYGLGMQGVENITTLGGGMGMSAGAPMQADKDDDDIAEMKGPELNRMLLNNQRDILKQQKIKSEADIEGMDMDSLLALEQTLQQERDQRIDRAMEENTDIRRQIHNDYYYDDPQKKSRNLADPTIIQYGQSDVRHDEKKRDPKETRKNIRENLMNAAGGKLEQDDYKDAGGKLSKGQIKDIAFVSKILKAINDKKAQVSPKARREMIWGEFMGKSKSLMNTKDGEASVKNFMMEFHTTSMDEAGNEKLEKAMKELFGA